MNKYDVVLQIQNDTVLVVEVLTVNSGVIDTITEGCIDLCENVPNGFYYATVDYSGACKCFDVRYCNCGASGCSNIEWHNLTRIENEH